jgi:threonyl-tRNA synthetase
MAFSMKWAYKNGKLSLFSLNAKLIPSRPVVTADYPALEKLSESVIKEKQRFQRLVVSKENLLEMFGVGPPPF